MRPLSEKLSGRRHDDTRPQKKRQPGMKKIDAHTAHSAPETSALISDSGVAKARLSWGALTIKSIIGGMFISLGSAFDLVVAGGASGLRKSNPSIVTMLAGFTFPIGFVLTVLTNVELCTSNMAVMFWSTLQRRTTVWDLVRNWVVSYLGNMAGCLFFAGVLTWWADVLETGAQVDWAIEQAEGRVNIGWGYNFVRAIGCNWLVGLAVFLATSGKDNISKIVGIWVTVWAFVGLGYQHSIANFYLIPIGMFYGTSFSVGKFIYNSVIPVTLGNIVGGAFMMGGAFWFLYGREEEVGRDLARQGGNVDDDGDGAAKAGVDANGRHGENASSGESTSAADDDAMKRRRTTRSGTTDNEGLAARMGPGDSMV